MEDQPNNPSAAEKLEALRAALEAPVEILADQAGTANTSTKTAPAHLVPVRVIPDKDVVLFDLGRPVAQLRFDVEQARAIAQALRQAANQVERAEQTRIARGGRRRR